MVSTNFISTQTTDTLATDSAVWHQFVLTAEKGNVETFIDSFQFQARESYGLNDSLLALGSTIPDKGVNSPLRKHNLNNDANTAGLLLLIFIITAIIFSKGRYLLAYRIKDFFHSKRKYSDEFVNPNTSGWRNTLALCSVVSLSLSMIVYNYTYNSYSNSMWNPYIPFIVVTGCFVAALAWIYLKGLLYQFLNWIFFDRESNKKWMSSYFLMNSLSAFAVFPIALLAIFGNLPLQITLFSLLFVLISVKILLFFKIANNFKVKNAEYLFIFLYFCAVEIVPALAIWQIFSNTDRNLTVIFS